MERLQRILSARGIASRRVAEEMIVAGRVSVNGDPVTELGAKANPETDVIRVDGKIVRPQRRRYVMLNKPRGYITTTSDERDRHTVMELVNTRERLYPIGRLDRETEGLLLLTNDGELANRVMHPRFGLEKEYHILTPELPDPRVLERVRRGIEIEGKRVIPNEFRILRETREGVVLTIALHEGMYHVVRRMMDFAGIPVEKLTRVRVGPLSVSGLPVGSWRDLHSGEESTLFEAVHMDVPESDAAIKRVTEIEREQSRRRTPEPPRPRTAPRATAITRDERRPSERREVLRRDGQPPSRRDLRPRDGQQPPERRVFQPRDGQRPPERRDLQPRDSQQPPQRRVFQPRDGQRLPERRDFQPRDGQPSDERRVFQHRDEQQAPERRDLRPRDGQPSDERRVFQPRNNLPSDERRGPRRFNPQRDAWGSPAQREEATQRDQRNQPQQRPDRPNRDFNPRDRDERTPQRAVDHAGRPVRERERPGEAPKPRKNERDERAEPSGSGNSRRDRGKHKDQPRELPRVKKPKRRDDAKGAAPRNDGKKPRSPQSGGDRRPGRGGKNDGGARTGEPDRSDTV